ncbi:zinc finger protein 470-like isoform X2 [Ochlerotatus camptorhynchus]|uniref:zinc finger protein 470-like isoform X2 n=1 Tax=Ochlerotatus camptorhynchus TaxID=644619 RepID=UPI0031E2CC4D
MDAVSCEIKKEKSDELICRLCFLEREHFRLIFIDTYSSLDEWIENLTSLKISEVPGAPAALCLECQNMLQNFESFREMCFTNDRVFKEMFTQNDHTGVTETSSVNQLVATKMDAVSCEIKKEKSAELICRLCFMEREHYRLIFIDTYSSLDEWIENLTSLKINKVSGAPATLCLECQNILKNFESFREMCFTNDRVFKEMFTQNNHTGVTETNSVVSEVVDTTEIAEYEDIKIALNYTVNPEENYDDEKEKQLELITNHPKSTHNIAEENQVTVHQTNVLHTGENIDYNISPTDQLDENTETDDDGILPFEKKDDAITKKGNSAKHKRKSIRKDYPPIKCEFCSKKFNAKHKYHNHIRRHRIEKSYICSYCDKAFISSAELNVHLRSHTLERPFKCKNCDKSFKTTSHLSRHNKSYCKINKNPDDNKKPLLQCEYCSKTFMVKWRFEAHTRMHTVEKTNICSYCSEVFKNPAELKVHVKIHKQETYFKCDACDKLFSTSSLLSRHSQSYCEVQQQRNDMQVKSYKCEECDASFDSSNRMMQHMRSHPGVKPYTCDVCQSKFSTSGNLIRHKRHTKRHTYTCEECQLKFTLPEHLVRHKKEHLTQEMIH